MPEVTAPLLLLWGDKDPFTPMDGPVGRYFQSLPSSRPETQFRVLANVGHWQVLDGCTGCQEAGGAECSVLLMQPAGRPTGGGARRAAALARLPELVSVSTALWEGILSSKGLSISHARPSSDARPFELTSG